MNDYHLVMSLLNETALDSESGLQVSKEDLTESIKTMPL
jgi:hypothetical protein